MSRRRFLSLPALTGALLLAAAVPVLAADGQTTAGGSMQAGPGSGYRQAHRLGAGLDVTIHGCLAVRDWCDVSWRGNRGWVAAEALAYGARSKGIGGPASASRADMPVISFRFPAYWDENYSQRLWYSERAKMPPSIQ